MQLENFRSQLNSSAIILSRAQGQIALNARNERETRRQLHHIVHLLPRLLWQSSVVESTIVMTSADLRTIMDEYTRGRVAPAELATLLNVTEIGSADNQDTVFYSVERVAQHTIRLKFTIAHKSTDSKVFRVRPFIYWDQLISKPEFRSYHGKLLAVHNATNNCVKGIDESATLQLDEVCDIPNFVDPDISIWRTESSIKKNKEIASMHNTTGFLFCPTMGIVLRSKSGKTTLFVGVRPTHSSCPRRPTIPHLIITMHTTRKKYLLFKNRTRLYWTTYK